MRKGSKCDGFSLIEVLIAIGILGVALFFISKSFTSGNKMLSRSVVGGELESERDFLVSYLTTNLRFLDRNDAEIDFSRCQGDWCKKISFTKIVESSQNISKVTLELEQVCAPSALSIAKYTNTSIAQKCPYRNCGNNQLSAVQVREIGASSGVLLEKRHPSRKQLLSGLDLCFKNSQDSKSLIGVIYSMLPRSEGESVDIELTSSLINLPLPSNSLQIMSKQD